MSKYTGRVRSETDMQGFNSEQNDKPPEIVSLLQSVSHLLQQNEPEKALEVAVKSKSSSIWVKNAIGVCQLRSGNVSAAVLLYRTLLLTGGIHLRTDVPAAVKVNFAIALLESNNISGFTTTLGGLNEEEHPAVKRLRAGIEAWQKSLSLWQMLQFKFGMQPNVPLKFDFPLGELE